MVITTDKKLFSITDVSRAISKEGALKCLEKEFCELFELSENVTEKQNYYNLKSKKGYSGESPLVFKSNNIIGLYYDLLLGEFYIKSPSLYWDRTDKRGLVSVLVGVETFEGFIKKYYKPENNFIIYSKDNELRRTNYQNRDLYPRVFEITDVDLFLNLLQERFKGQYLKNLKYFLQNDPNSLPFSSKIKEEVFPFFLKNSMDYKVNYFSEHYSLFCTNNQLKEEYLFLSDIFQKFKEDILTDCYSGVYGFKDSVLALRKAGTTLEDEIQKILRNLLNNDKESFDKGYIKINESSLIHYNISAIETYINSPENYSIDWNFVLSAIAEVVSQFIIYAQEREEWFLEVVNKAHLRRSYDIKVGSLLLEYLATNYAKDKVYKFDFSQILSGSYYLSEVNTILKSIKTVVQNDTSIQINLFHLKESDIHPLLLKNEETELFFNYLFDSLEKDKKKRIVFKKSELEVAKKMFEINILAEPVPDFFKRVKEFTII